MNRDALLAASDSFGVIVRWIASNPEPRKLALPLLKEILGQFTEEILPEQKLVDFQSNFVLELTVKAHVRIFGRAGNHKSAGNGWFGWFSADTKEFLGSIKKGRAGWQPCIEYLPSIRKSVAMDLRIFSGGTGLALPQIRSAIVQRYKTSDRERLQILADEIESAAI